MSHGVGPDHGNVVVLSRVRDPVPSGLFPDVIDQLVPDFQSEDQVVGEQGRQAEQQTTEPAADVNHGDCFGQFVVAGIVVKWGVLDSVAVHFEVVFGSSALEEGWVVWFPVDVGVMRREGEGGCVERIDMGPHPVLSPFWHDPFYFNLLVVFVLLLELLLVLAFGMVSFHYYCFKYKVK